MRHANLISPLPLRWIVGADVAQSSRPAGLRHAADELRRELRDHGCRQADLLEAARRERDLKRRGRRRLFDTRARHRRRAQPCFRGRNVLHAHERVSGFGQALVSEADHALHVVEIDLHRRHRRATHSSAARPLNAAVSNPSRTRTFLSRSFAVRPGYALYQTCVGIWWRRRYSLNFRSS